MDQAIHPPLWPACSRLGILASPHRSKGLHLVPSIALERIWVRVSGKNDELTSRAIKYLDVCICRASPWINIVYFNGRRADSGSHLISSARKSKNSKISSDQGNYNLNEGTYQRGATPPSSPAQRSVYRCNPRLKPAPMAPRWLAYDTERL
jgi:hypothetical protein